MKTCLVSRKYSVCLEPNGTFNSSHMYDHSSVRVNLMSSKVAANEKSLHLVTEG